MSLSTALNNALSGLTATSRAVDVVSSNVANAMTDGYARREITLASQTIGANGSGVLVVGVSRIVNERALADLRQASADTSNAATQAEAWLRIEKAIGYPTEDGSLMDRIDKLEAAFISAASRPEETIRLQDAVSAASSLVTGLNDASDEIQQMRMDADSDIATMVKDVNSQLKQIETLNRQIFRMANVDLDVASLMDQRQKLVDSIAEVVPIRQVARDGNQIALFTTSGSALIDGQASELSFEAHTTITAEMSVENGVLSGVQLNGAPLKFGTAYGSLTGGRLAAAIDVRDRIAPEAQAGLDAVARSLIERFQDPALDPTVAVNGTGLFTEGGQAYVAGLVSDDAGLASRIALNASVDPAQGGAVWRIRDGVGATVPGEVGNSSLLTALADKLSETIAPTGGVSDGLARSLSGLAADLLSSIDGKYRVHESTQAFHAARADALKYEMAADSVDTDDEMQKLLLIEQAYAANARVIQTVDQLMQHLLEL